VVLALNLLVVCSQSLGGFALNLLSGLLSISWWFCSISWWLLSNLLVVCSQSLGSFALNAFGSLLSQSLGGLLSNLFIWFAQSLGGCLDILE
jgi:hypothetical protein